MTILNLLASIKQDTINTRIVNYILIVYMSLLLTFPHLSDSMLILSVIIFCFNENVKEHLLFAVKNKVVQAFILYFLLHVIWTLGSEHIETAIYQITKNIILLFSIFFVAAIREEFLKKFFYTFLIILFLSSLWSIFMYLGIATSFYSVNPLIPFLYKSDFGLFLLIGIAYILLSLINKINKNKFILLFFIIFFLIASFTIFIIGARIYMFGYITLFLAILILTFKNVLLKFTILFFFFSSIFTLFYFTIPQAHKQVNNVFTNIQKALIEQNYNTSSGARIGMIKYSLPVINENILFGVGTGDHVPEVLKQIHKSLDLNQTNNHELIRALNIGHSSFLHNTYIQLLVEFGIIGLILFLNIFYRILSYKADNPFSENMLLILSLLWLFICISGADFIYNQAGKIFILMIVIFMTVSKNSHGVKNA